MTPIPSDAFGTCSPAIALWEPQIRRNKLLDLPDELIRAILTSHERRSNPEILADMPGRRILGSKHLYNLSLVGNRRLTDITDEVLYESDRGGYFYSSCRASRPADIRPPMWPGIGVTTEALKCSAIYKAVHSCNLATLEKCARFGLEVRETAAIKLIALCRPTSATHLRPRRPSHYIRELPKSLLHIAIAAGHDGVIVWLLENGADVNQRAHTDEIPGFMDCTSAITLALCKRDLATSLLLLQRGAVADPSDGNIFYEVLTSFPRADLARPIIEQLVRSGMVSFRTDQELVRTEEFMTSITSPHSYEDGNIYRAGMKDMGDMLKLLIGFGMDHSSLGPTRDFSQTQVGIAITNGFYDLALVLMECGACPNLLQQHRHCEALIHLISSLEPNTLDCTQGPRLSPLARLFAYLIKHGAHTYDCADGRTCLASAISSGSFWAFSMLIEGGANVTRADMAALSAQLIAQLGDCNSAITTYSKFPVKAALKLAGFVLMGVSLGLGRPAIPRWDEDAAGFGQVLAWGMTGYGKIFTESFRSRRGVHDSRYYTLELGTYASQLIICTLAGLSVEQIETFRPSGSSIGACRSTASDTDLLVNVGNDIRLKVICVDFWKHKQELDKKDMERILSGWKTMPQLF